VVREVIELLLPLEKLGLRVAAPAEIMDRDGQHAPLAQCQRIAGGLHIARRSVFRALEHLDRRARSGLLEAVDEVLRVDAFRTEDVGEGDCTSPHFIH